MVGSLGTRSDFDGRPGKVEVLIDIPHVQRGATLGAIIPYRHPKRYGMVVQTKTITSRLVKLMDEKAFGASRP